MALAATNQVDTSQTNLSSGIVIKSGFRIELVASEPQVLSPVAMAFDEEARMFVVERSEQDPAAGRIRLLEDPDHQGRFTVSTLYAEGIPWASAIACYDGGVFVASENDILYLKDNSITRKAESKSVVFSGFGNGSTNTSSTRPLLHSLTWGPDNRIYGGTAGIGGLVSSGTTPKPVPVLMDGSDFSFDPRTLSLRREAGPSESGLSFDPAGQRYLCDSSRPVRVALYSGLYLERNPFFPAPPQVLDVGNPATLVFGLAMDRGTNAGVIGTKKLLSANQGLTNQNAAWMTRASGLLVYGGTAFPTNYYGNVFVADRENHLIHRALLRDNDFMPFTQRPPDERNSEFLASRDASFRPVALVNGPDGGIYVADLNSGVGRGRIYRIVPTGFKEPAFQSLAKAGTNELVGALINTNAWNHETAARVIHTRQERSVLPMLTNVLYQSRNPLARLRALNAFAGLGALTEPTLIKALTDTDERVRRVAVEYCQATPFSTHPSDVLANRLQALSVDPSIKVRMQLAFTLGEVERSGRDVTLEGLLRRDFTNRWMQAAVLSSLPPSSAPIFRRLGSDAQFRSSALGQPFLREMARMFGVRGDLQEARQALEFLYGPGMGQDQAFELIYELGQGLQLTRSGLALVDPQMAHREPYTAALIVATAESASPPVRIRAIQLLSVSPFSFKEIGDWLLLLVNPREAPAVQRAAIQALGRLHDPGVATGLLQRWRTYQPELRSEAAAVLIARAERLLPLLSAMESGTVRPMDLSATQLNFLRTHPEPGISQRAIRLFGTIVAQRPDLLTKFRPALTLSGSSPRGRELFTARCVRCHLSSPGTSIGEGLAGAKTKPKEILLSDILEPHRDIRPGSITTELDTKDGDTWIGIVTRETERTVALRQENGIEVIISRVNIGIIRPQAWSLMPQGLEAGLGPQDMADLLKYIAEIPWP